MGFSAGPRCYTAQRDPGGYHKKTGGRQGSSGGKTITGRSFRNAREIIAALEVFALGELQLTPEQFANYTVRELDALTDGYRRRYERLEDLFILHVALPVYRAAYGRKAPTYRKLTAHRHRTPGYIGTIDPETAAKWRKILGAIK